MSATDAGDDGPVEHEPNDPRSDPSGGGDRAAEGLDHLQTAMREIISAARAFLDVAEDLVDDPRTAGAMTAVASAITDAARRGREAMGASAADEGTDPHDGGVERIVIS